MKPGAASTPKPGEAARPLPEGARRSHALEQFTAALARSAPIQILDLGGINQDNLDFLAGQGHRLYAENLIRAADATFPAAAKDAVPDERALEDFLQQTFPFPNSAAGAALVWDQLQFLAPPLAEAVVARLHRILAPDAPLLAFFHPDTTSHAAAPFVCRIVDDRHLTLRPRTAPRPFQAFTPRTIERLFQNFHSIKFFMTRESIQEVIARR